MIIQSLCNVCVIFRQHCATFGRSCAVYGRSCATFGQFSILCAFLESTGAMSLFNPCAMSV